MNIHPLFVHFPIALLLLYAIIKILPLRTWLPSIAWAHIERVLLVVGVIGAFMASYTGEMAEHIVRPSRQIVEMHSLFATMATWLFGALLIGEIAAWLHRTYIETGCIKTTLGRSFIIPFYIILYRTKSIVFVFALIGLLSLSLAGLLGGVLVYGTTADPIAPLILKLLGL